MPYAEYLKSAGTSIYEGSTFSSSLEEPAFGSSYQNTFSGEGGCGPFGAYGIVTFSETLAGGYSSGGGQQAGGGLYSFSRLSTFSAYAFSSFNQVWASPGGSCTGVYVPVNTSNYEDNNEFVTNSESQQTILSDKAITISGDYLTNGVNQDGQASQKTQYSFTAVWNPASSQFSGSGTVSYTTFYSNSDTTFNTTTTAPYSPAIPAYYLNYKITLTTLQVELRKTTQESYTFYGPIEGSTTEYTQIILTTESATLTGIKTTIADSPFWDVQGLSRTFNIEWLGYAGEGAQNLGLVYTATAVSKDISAYDAVLIETDSFSSSNQRDSFAYGASFTDEYTGSPYTLTYDIITTATVASQTTLLEKELFYLINSFYYGFISSYTTGTTIYTAGTSSETTELTSYSKQVVATYNSDNFAVSGVSYSVVQTISTTSSFIQFVELSGLHKAKSFIVRSFVATTAPYTYRNNAAGISVDVGGNPDGRSYSFAPAFAQNGLVLRSPEESNPDTFYTEKASFASFAEPDYSTAYNGYSPANCSLVFLALLPLDTDASYYSQSGQYPSWISVYDGTFSGDRASTSNQSVTVSQSSSYVGTGATNAYQTITYFIGNNSDSQTTRTTSVAMALVNSASSVFRLARIAVENLDSAYINAYLPSVKLDGSNVFFTQGLQGNASYNMDRLLLNEYTTAKSTFAGSATSSFPISVSSMPYPIYRNKIRIDKAYNPIENNSFSVGLLRYSFFYDE